MTKSFTVYHLPFTVRYPFTALPAGRQVHRYSWSRDKGKGRVNSEGLRAKGAGGVI